MIQHSLKNKLCFLKQLRIIAKIILITLKYFNVFNSYIEMNSPQAGPSKSGNSDTLLIFIPQILFKFPFHQNIGTL